MPISEALLEVREYAGAGYMPLIDFGAWRVAVMRFADTLAPAKLDTMQRHNETDEVFVLLMGRCILFIGEGGERLDNIHAADMAPLKLYNVKKGVWHTHALSPDASVLIVENRDTSSQNSTMITLDAAQKQKLVKLAGQLGQGIAGADGHP